MTSDSTKITSYPGLGNGLTATRDFDPGEAILEVSEPFLVLLEKMALDDFCSFCHIQCPRLKRCSGCRIAQYCSAMCQTNAWKANYHKLECPAYRRLPDTPPTAVRGLMQLLLRKEVQKPGAEWTALEGHAEGLKSGGRWDEIMLQAQAAVSFTKSQATDLVKAVNLLCRMATNAFRLTTADNQPIGLCFDPAISRANHSCTPNAFINFNRRSVSLLPLERIRKDDQIFISYIDPTQSRNVRRVELQDRYFFNCNCARCLHNETPYSSFLKHVSPVFHRSVEILTPFEDLKAQATHNIQDRSLEAYAMKAPDIAQLLSNLVDTHRFGDALALTLHNYFNSQVILYPQPHHPERVARLLTIARLLKCIASLHDEELRKSTNVVPLITLTDLDTVSATHLIILLITELAPLSHGPSSRFAIDATTELLEVHGVQQQRGPAGERLEAWVKDGKDPAGEAYARKIVGGLRAIGAWGSKVEKAAGIGG